MSALFEPFELKSHCLHNRIAVPPMCQYMANEGLVNEWHHIHYASIARGGAGLVIVEATAVSPKGRITPSCAGLWSDKQGEAFIPIVQAIKAAGSVAGIQLAHAGRKASANRPWEGNGHIAENDQRSWQTIAPSAIAFGAHLSKVSRAMSLSDIAQVREEFVMAARRPLSAGFEWLELHFAHGYLGQSFVSAHSNRRTDDYGGNMENRRRFLIETMSAVREVWPYHLALTVRLGVIKYDNQDEQTLLEAIALVRQLKNAGADLVNVSTGFNTPNTDTPWAPAFLAPIAERIRHEAGIPVAAAWGIESPALADRLVRDGQTDLVMVGRAHLADPHWPYAAAHTLGVERPAWVLPPLRPLARTVYAGGVIRVSAPVTTYGKTGAFHATMPRVGESHGLRHYQSL